MKKFGAILIVMVLVLGSVSTVSAEVQPRYGNTGYIYYCVGTGYNDSNEYIDTTQEAKTVQEYVQGWGYDCGSFNFFKNPAAKEFSEGRLNSPIVYFAGHGNATSVDCGNSGISIDGRYSPFVDIRNFNFNAVDLAFLAACKSVSITNSITHRFIDGGATYAIGWVGSPSTAHMLSFVKAYFLALDKGNTFEQAEDYARLKMHDYTAGLEKEDIYTFKSEGTKTACPDTNYGRSLSGSSLVDLFLEDKDGKSINYVVNDVVSYQKGSSNYSKIEKYMKENINPNFDMNDYIVSEESFNYAGKQVIDLLFTYVVNDMRSNFAYDILIEDGNVVLVRQIGTDITDYVPTESRIAVVDDEIVRQMATEEIEHKENIDEQKVYKYFDSDLKKVKYEVQTVVGTDETGYSCVVFEYVP